MNKVLMGLTALPFLAGAAIAGQPLTDQQLDRVTAGFTATSISNAEGVVGESGVLLTTTATLAEVAPFATGAGGEITTTLFKSVAAAQASSVTSTIVVLPIPGVSPNP